jgi:PAS domain S-box-containing protein
MGREVGRASDDGGEPRVSKNHKRANSVTERTASEDSSELENFRRTLGHESFSHLVAGVGDYAIFLLDAQGYVRSWNTGAERSKGYRADEIIGRHFSIFYPAEAVEKHRPERALSLAIRNGRFAEENWRVRKDGSRFWASVTLTALRGEDGTVTGFLKITRDLTDRRKIQALQEANRQKSEFVALLEKRVQERTAQLTDSNAQLEAFAYTVSHDLKAPLRGIQGFSQALLEDYQDKLDDRARDYLQRIGSGILRMQMLIEDLLEHSQLSRAEFRLAPVDLSSAVQEALKMLEGEIKLTKAKISVRGPMPVVVAQPSALVQSIQNLLSNAIKFTDDGQAPQIRISAQKIGEKARLYVEDKGIGIEERHFDRIFQIFERLHGSESFSGTGIGLAIVKKAIERMGGRCGVDSKVGAGSKFWIELVLSG